MRLKALLTGDAEELARRTLAAEPRWILGCLGILVASCAIYGFTFGLWRGELQATFTALKLPLVILLTCGGNTLLNGCLALVLGTNLGFRQSSLAILMSFTLTGVILASFAPIMLFLLWNTPALGSPESARGGSITLLAHVALIGFAGVVGNCRLWQLIRRLTGSISKAHTVLFAWLAGNLLLGSQVSWILRPWIGRSDAEITFFSAHPMQGNFFEAVWHALTVLLKNSNL